MLLLTRRNHRHEAPVVADIHGPRPTDEDLDGPLQPRKLRQRTLPSRDPSPLNLSTESGADNAEERTSSADSDLSKVMVEVLT